MAPSAEWTNMTRTDTNLTVVPSILDRLDDRDDGCGRRSDLSHADLREIKESVRRDVECLLNTRNTFVETGLDIGSSDRARPLDPEFEQARTSVLAYGLPDMTGYNTADETHVVRMFTAIVNAITHFEPRLADVRIVPSQESTGKGDGQPGARPVRERVVRVRIEASLKLGKSDHPFAFDIMMPVSSYRCQVQAAG
jgi:type VI secretion system protein ImpF